MSLIPLGTGVMNRTDSPVLIPRNCFYEPDPTNVDTQISMISRPGVVNYFHLPQGPVRGVLAPGGVFDPSRIYAVAGNQFYSVQFGATGFPLGTVAGFDASKMVAAGNYILFNGGGVLYAYQILGVPTPVSLPEPKPVIAVAYLAGYFLVIQENSQRVYFSAPNTPTFDPLDYFSAESEADFLYAIETFGDELWLFGPNSVEVEVPTGDPDLPFQRVPGRTFTMGVAGRTATCKSPEGITFVGRDRVVYRTAGAPQRISDSTIEQALQAHSGDNLTLWSYALEGHSFAVLSISTVETLAYDLTTNKWCQNSSPTSTRWDVQWSTKDALDRVIVGSSIDGNIWYLDPTRANDNGAAFPVEFMGAAAVVGSPARCDNVIMDCTVGSANAVPPGDDPTIQLRTSEDRGKTWGGWLTQKLGLQGRFDWSVVWNRLGLMKRPGRIFHWRVTSFNRFTVRQARMNEYV